MLEGKDRAAATLDYTKFFDRFDPQFYMRMLKTMGYLEGLAEMQIDMYKNFVRHITLPQPTENLLNRNVAWGKVVACH